MSKKEINLKNDSHEINFHLHIHYGPKGIYFVELQPSERKFSWTFINAGKNHSLEREVNHWLENFSQKRPPSSELPLDWTKVTPFTERVLKAVASIPFGSVLTYGQVADSIGRPEAARAVGGACRRNPFLLFIPCHRVLDAKFRLRGYSAGGISVKQKLLNFEGFYFDG